MTLTPPQSEMLERSLDRIERDVRGKIHETLPQRPDDKYMEQIGIVNDFGDEALESTRLDINHALLERYLRELELIEAVRRRIAEGEVDRCVECGESIDYERLIAYPFATRCVECQERQERFGPESEIA